MANMSSVPKRTVPYLLGLKEKGQKLVALTAYDYSFAALIDSTETVDVLLVGDSAATVFQGLDNTIPISLDEMIYHTSCVSRAVNNALVVGDLPFLSYQVSPEQALESAGRMLKEGGAAAVKLEGGVVMRDTIARLVDVDIPVMGHVGLTPQSYHRMGGHKVQGKRSQKRSQTSPDEVLKDALAVEEAGAFAIVLEGIPTELATDITESVSIPTIGIGAGAGCNGQILVTHDLLGLQPNFAPRFVKRYREIGKEVQAAVREYASEVRESKFPTAEHAVSDQPKVHLAKK